MDTEDIEIQPKKLLEFQIIDSVPAGGKRPLSTEFVKVETKLDDKEWGECRYIFTCLLYTSQLSCVSFIEIPRLSKRKIRCFYALIICDFSACYNSIINETLNPL